MPDHSWQCGIVLVACSVVGNLHWSVIGTEDHPKVILQCFIDPPKSVIAKTLHKFVCLMTDWSLRDGWHLLQWLGRSSVDDKKMMSFARAILVRLSAGVFLSSELKFSCFP